MSDVHHLLAKYLDALPAGYPPTEDGVEIRILRKLFSAEEAALALHLNLLGDEVRVIAFKAGQPPEKVADLLGKMEQKGLISVSHSPGKPPTYAISQFVIGFYEGQVNKLDVETATLFEAYAPIWWQQGPWKKLPQIRTIPVMEAIPITSEVMPYEQAGEILRSKSQIAVRNCICRQEQELLGKGCGKPMEVCLSFDGAARNTVETGKGRMISLEEALAILDRARTAGLVLQPSNSQKPIILCACCSCCCGVLRHIKNETNPGDLVANPFVACHEADSCIACGSCVEVCPMAALTLDAGNVIHFDQIRCIGCGLCISVCPSEAMQLVRKPPAEQPKTPKDTLGTYIGVARARGAGNFFGMVWTLIKAYISRIRVPR
ncbi:MAG: ATP-binding protein [Flexilinea sp.]